MVLTAQKTFTTGAVLPASDLNGNVRDWMNASPMAVATAKDQMPYATATAPSAVAMLKVRAINVRNYGAVGDGVTDDSTAFTNAFAAATNGTIVVPPGTYLVNVTTGLYRPIIEGAGQASTIIASYSSGGIALKLGGDGSWTGGVVRDLTIQSGGGTRRDIGVQFGSTSHATNDEYMGRWRFENVKFTNLDICVSKPYGNIGNRFERCYFDSANYHIKSYSRAAADAMHGGCDTFDTCHFQSAQLASYFISSSLDGTGQVVFRGCIWEANPGFCIFVYNFVNYGIGAGLTIEDCWNENNYTTTPVTIDSVSYTTAFMYLRNCESATIVRTTLGPITLINSTLFADDCIHASLVVTQDANSAFIASNANVDGNSGAAAYVRNIKRSSKDGPAAQSAVFVVPQRTKVSHKYASNILMSRSGGDTTTWTGTASIASTTVADGLLFDAAQEIVLPASYTEQLGPVWAATNNYWLVWTAEVKQTSGAAPASMGLNGSAGFGSYASIVGSDWKTFAGLSRLSAAVTADYGIYLQSTAAGAITMRVGAVQVLQFATLQEAVEFLDSGVFAVQQAQVPREVFGTIAPTTGTWAVGDTVLNSAPAVDTPPGWRCTAAGTPGTWTALPNLGVGQRVSLYDSTAWSIANVTNTPITMDTELEDTNAFHAAGGTAERITIPSTAMAGRYRCTACVHWAAGTGGGAIRIELILVPVATNVHGVVASCALDVAPAGAFTQAIQTAPMSVLSGDYFYLRAYQATGVARAFTTASPYSPSLFAERVGP